MQGRTKTHGGAPKRNRRKQTTNDHMSPLFTSIVIVMGLLAVMGIVAVSYTHLDVYKRQGRGGALAVETPNAEMHAGVRRPPRRRIPCGSLRKGGRFRQTKSDKTNNPKPDCRPISQYCTQNGLSKPIVCRNFAV